MFAFNLLVLALGAASSVVALPTKRDTAPSCAGLGGGAFDTASNFTLSAYYTDESLNTNTTGVPLVLGQAGAISGASFKVLSVRTRLGVPC